VRRFFVDPQDIAPEGSVTLAGDEFHHLRNVCRLEEGERVELLDGRGRIATAKIQTIGKKSAELTIEDIRDLPPPPQPRVTLVICVPRFQKMDLIIQKSVELGADRIIPVVSERSFVKTLSKDLDSKVKRWRKIASEACKQSGRAWPLEIADFTKLAETMKSSVPERSLFLYEGEGTRDVKSALTAWGAVKEPLTVFIGAEGGFSRGEVEEFSGRGFAPVTMGPLVLRVETACITILSVIQYHFDLMR
jgi:16S rRNA (uracil1498-N3)-methyltransferase